MRGEDIQPGVVYAYRQNRYDPPRPIVFLAPVDRDHLYIESQTYGPRFKKAPEGSTPRVGTIYSGGTIGYPAALGDPASNLDDLRAVTLARFRGVTSTLGRRCEYALITALARVIGPWEETAPADSSGDA
ncbi:hypothetical protein GCM10017559_07860 [Streptosporangium longisporum]|uniref:Uncharacterized protein n=1 Tax=Streptosporangium longisporum TaxID=46187 RepID=A0ABP6K7W4_9ACTN